MSSGTHEAELPPGHYHHFEPEQAYHSAKFGMWLFLGTEVLFFGGLFCAYAVFHWKHYEMFHHGAQTLNWKLGFLNTCVLLVSSFFMAWSVDAAQHGENEKVAKRLWVTLICGVIFMVVKYIEYTSKFDHGIYPGSDHWNLFYGLYFSMTGLHGLHVLVGLFVLWWVKGLAKRKMYSTTYYTPVEVVGLYWHLVDLIWIYLFPLLYLIS